MPLVAWSVLVYCASLIVALTTGDAPKVALGFGALALTLYLIVSKRWSAALVAAIGAGAVLVASAVLQFDRHCAPRLAHAASWTADFESAVRDGDVAHTVVRDGTCLARATMLIEHGSAAAGERATVHGMATVDPRGLFIEHGEIGENHPANVWLRMRAAAGHRIDRIFPADAPMVRALVIADMSGISADVRDRYAQAGLVHMLSVSGLHVGIVALALELLASVCRLPRTPSRIATLILLAAYVTAIGAPPPAVRAAVMLAAVLLTRVMQRPTSPWAILALGALTPLWDTRTAIDLGWQLSVAGTAALIAGGSLARRVIPRKWRGWRRSLSTAAIVSVVATMVTAPLVAWTFGRVALLSPLTNLVADPIMALLQPLLFLGIAIPVSGIEHLAADAAHALLYGFDGVARVAVLVPYAAPAVYPSATGAVLAGVSAVALIIACVAREFVRPLLASSVALLLLVVTPLVPGHRSDPELHMIDVGQGDALAIRTSKGRWIVIDAGRSWPGGDAGKSVVVPYLARRGGDIALFVLSHPHADHVGGAASLFVALHPARFLDPGYVGTSPPYRDALARARAGSIPWQRARAGDSLVVDDIVLHELAPDSAWASHLHDANLASSVLSVRIGGSQLLLTGDAEGPEEEWLLEHCPDALRADVLKVAHHGSSTSTTPAFLDAVRPALALVSVGARNTYGHPDADVMDRLREMNAITLRTDLSGTVILRFTKDGIVVSAKNSAWTLPKRSSNDANEGK